MRGGIGGPALTPQPPPPILGEGGGGEGAPDDAPRWLLLCALFLACGLLSHYDAALTAPAVAYLVVARWRAVPGSLRRERWAVAAGFALGTGLLAAFYVPLVRHPYFQSTTLKYLVDVRLGGGGGDGGGAPYDALPKWMGLANFYSSAYYLAAVDLLVAAAVTVRLVRRWPRAGWAAAAFGALAIPALVLRPDWFAVTSDPEGRSWAIVVVLVLLALFVLAAPHDPAWTTTALWLAAPVLFYATLVEAPRTHFHTVFPALSLMAGGAVVAVLGWGVGEGAPYPSAPSALPPFPRWRRGKDASSAEEESGSAATRTSSPATAGEDRRATARREGARGGAIALAHGRTGSLARTLILSTLVVVGAYSAFYSWQVLVQHDVAYKRAYPDVKVAGAWYPFAELPGSGWFGFPYRAGWKAVGSIAGDYDSNEEPAITAWYTRSLPRCGEAPSSVLIATRVQDRQPVLDPAADEAPDAPPSDQLLVDAGYVQVTTGEGGQDKVAVWRKGSQQNDAQDIQRRIEGANSDVILLNGAMTANFGRRFTDYHSGPHYDAGLPYDRPSRLVDLLRSDAFGEPAALRLDGWRLDAGGYFPPSGYADDRPDMRSANLMSGRWEAVPGDRLIFTLAWSALAPPIPPIAQVFVHLEREGERTIGQSDGPPRPPVETVCGKPRALASLTAGEAVQDRRVIDVTPDAPPGEYDLLVGIYDYETGERMQVTGGPDAGRNRVRLTSVRIVDTPSEYSR